jgi:hypothetical protein
MIPTLFVFHKDPLIVLVEDLPRRWWAAQLRNDLRTWRALGVYLFDCAALLAKEDLQWIADFHDTLATVAMQHAYDLQPQSSEDVFVQQPTSAHFA